MLLGKFLAEMPREEAAFVAAYPQPALLLAPFADPRQATIDTPSQPFRAGPAAAEDPARAETTEILKPAELARRLVRLDQLLGPDSRVCFLSKSERNPFAGLITAGRARNNDVVLEHHSVSKVHATFSVVAERWSVQDGRSRNGTYHNGQRLAEGEKRELDDGDAVGLGGEVSGRFLLPASLFRLVTSAL